MDAASVAPDFTGFGDASGAVGLGNLSSNPPLFILAAEKTRVQSGRAGRIISGRETRSPSALRTPATMTEARLNELEAKLAFAEDLIETLNQTVIRQQAQLDSLQQQLRLLHQRLQDMQPEDDGRNPRDELPPHY